MRFILLALSFVRISIAADAQLVEIYTRDFQERLQSKQIQTQNIMKELDQSLEGCIYSGKEKIDRIDIEFLQAHRFIDEIIKEKEYELVIGSDLLNAAKILYNQYLSIINDSSKKDSDNYYEAKKKIVALSGFLGNITLIYAGIESY